MRTPLLARLALPVIPVVAVGGIVSGAVAPAAAAGPKTDYSIAFTGASGLPADVDAMVAAAGGTITTRLPEIGGIGVSSTNPDFAAAMKSDNSVKAVAPDSPGREQCDKMRMNATLIGSYAVQRGRTDVRVFVIDTGADTTHPDVAPSLDVAESVSFVPDEPTIQDFNGLGTWTISALVAPINGIGISRVAPNVTLVAGKAVSGAGSGEFLFTDQALIYAGQKPFDIVSASLGGYIPSLGRRRTRTRSATAPTTSCWTGSRSSPVRTGCCRLLPSGKDGYDVRDGNFFRDYVEAPGEIAGWVGVAATGYNNSKASTRNYGTGKTDVSAPGGSTRDYSGNPGSQGPPSYGGTGRLIGAWSSTATSAPSMPFEECQPVARVPTCAEYGYVQGTSMATPNAAGVAALIIHQYGDFTGSNPNRPHMSPTQVEQHLQISANNQPCPEPRTVNQGAGFDVPTATFQGNTGYNSFFGKGIVDALKAVTLKTQ